MYLAGTNTRRVKRALFGLFKGAVSKDVVSRAWRKVEIDWDAWCARDLARKDIVRLILDGTVIKTRLDRNATNISVLAAIGVRRDGQKVLLSIKNMGGESTAAWSQFLTDLDARGLRRPEFAIVEGAPGLEAALISLWGDALPIQRCTVHKHRNLLAHAPIDDPVWVPTVFSKNRDRLLTTDMSRKVMATILAHREVAPLLLDEHFSVDGTLVRAWASMKVRPAQGGRQATGER